MTTADDIDALLATPKCLAGAPSWILDEKFSMFRLTVPIQRSGVIGALTLRASATRHTNPQRGSAVLLFEGRPIQRISIRPDHAHANPFADSTDDQHKGVRLSAGASRLHPWALNRAWPRAALDNVVVAQSIVPEPESFGEVLTVFLLVCGIEGNLPPPPWEPKFL